MGQVMFKSNLMRTVGLAYILFAQTSQSMITTEFNFHFPELGSGLRSFQEDFLANRCVANGQGQENATQMQRVFGNKNNKKIFYEESERENSEVGYRVEYSLHQIKNSEDLYSSLGLSIGARLKAEGLVGAVVPGNGEAKLDFAANHRFKSDRDYLLVKVRVRGQTVALSNKKQISFLPKYRQQENESMNNYISRILLDCGDVYFHSYVLGGELYGLIETTRAKDQSKQTNDQLFSIDFSAHKNAEVDLEQAVKTSLIKVIAGEVKQIWMIQSGGAAGDSYPVRNIDELSEKANHFPSLIEKAPVPMEALYQDYTELIRSALQDPYSAEANKVVATFHSNQGLFGRLGVIFSRWVQFDNDLDKRIENSRDKTSVEFYQKGKEVYNIEVGKITSYLQACSLDYLHCELGEFLTDFQTRLIEAREAYLPYEQEVKKEIVMIHPSSIELCPEPLTLNEIFTHLDVIRSKATKRGIGVFKSQCVIGLDNKTSEASPFTLTAESGACMQKEKLNVVRLTERRIMSQCSFVASGCELACYVPVVD